MKVCTRVHAQYINDVVKLTSSALDSNMLANREAKQALEVPERVQKEAVKAHEPPAAAQPTAEAAPAEAPGGGGGVNQPVPLGEVDLRDGEMQDALKRTIESGGDTTDAIARIIAEHAAKRRRG